MRKHCLVPMSILVIGIVIGIAMHAAIGQQTAPMQLKGMKVIKTSTLDLGPQIEEMRGYRLGMRVIQVEPAGCTPMHSHKDRPGMAYVLQGSVTEHGVGGTTERCAGDIWVEDRDTSHWMENSGTGPALVLAIDITKAP